MHLDIAGTKKIINELENKSGQWAVDATKKYSDKYGFDVKGGDTHNNEGDAFKHAYMQAGFAKSHPFFARFIGDRHENRATQPSGEKNMDLWNNAIGRQIAMEVRNEIRKEKGGFHPNIDPSIVSEYDDRVAKKYNIPITPQTVMTHYEFGLKNPKTSSAGKIDIIFLPPYPDVITSKIGDFIRNKVRWYSTHN